MKNKQPRYITLALAISISLVSLSEPQSAYAFDLGAAFNKLGDALAPAIDITDKRSAVRKFMRAHDVTDSSSTACKVIMSDGAATIAEGAATAKGAPGAGTAIISVFKSTCGNRPRQSSNSQSSEGLETDTVEAVTVEWAARTKIKELEIQGKVAEAKIVNDALVKIEQERQTGATDRTRLIQTALVAMVQAKSDAEIEQARIDLEKTKDTNSTNLQIVDINAKTQIRITELEQQGAKENAQLLAEALQKKTEAEQKGLVDVAKIQADALVRMTEAKTDVEFKKARLDAAVAKQTNLTNLLKDGVKGVFNFLISQNEVKIEQIRADKEVKKAEFEYKAALAKSGGGTQIPKDANLELIKSWELTTTTCSESVVSIIMDSKQYCVNPIQGLAAGSYRYIREQDRLEPIGPVSNPSNSPQQGQNNQI